MLGRVHRRTPVAVFLAAAAMTMILCAAAAQGRAQPLLGSPSPYPTSLLPAQTPALPEPISILAMVRNVLLAVDQANKTGNYTVLRDMSGPDFRDTNNASRLTQIFGPLVLQGVDLLAVAVVDPEYKEPPRITPKRMLYVAGTFPIRPRPVNFEILFENVRGQWRLYGISIAPVP